MTVFQPRLIALLLLVLFITGCTTTDRVVESWRGYPIEQVISQWGQPGQYDQPVGGFHADFTGWNDRFSSRDQPITSGRQTYRWTFTRHYYTPQRIETTQRQVGDKCITTTRVIPERWDSQTDWFKLVTDDQSLVIAGDSSYARKIFPFDRFHKKHRGWGSPRQ